MVEVMIFRGVNNRKMISRMVILHLQCHPGKPEMIGIHKTITQTKQHCIVKFAYQTQIKESGIFVRAIPTEGAAIPDNICSMG